LMLNGRLVTANSRDPNYRNKENPTKNPEQFDNADRKESKMLRPDGYEPADIYTEDPKLIGFKSNSKTFNDKDTCLNILDIRTSRLSNLFFPKLVFISFEKWLMDKNRLILDSLSCLGERQSDPSKLSKIGHGKIARS
ncbi:19767_t:CDS:2, partial [Gigaspora rosea]